MRWTYLISDPKGEKTFVCKILRKIISKKQNKGNL